jgi:LacI family transcriptional regulator
LITGRSSIVGLVVPDLLHPFFAQIAKVLSARLRERGYGVLIASSEEDPELEREEIDRLLSRRVDALIIASAQQQASAFDTIGEQSTPYVLIDRRFESHAAHFIGVDDVRAGEIATRHLIEQGCRRIAHIRGPAVSTGVGRLEGYLRVVGGDATVVEAAGSGDDRGPSAGYEATRDLLASGTPPDGIFCYNDPVALGAMRAILDAGARIPKDIAVAGCGNVLYADSLRIPLTTVDQNSQEIGERSAQIALALMDGKTPHPAEILIEPRLVVRASSSRRAQIASD